MVAAFDSGVRLNHDCHDTKIYISVGFGQSIMPTCPCKVGPLTPHFYIVKLEFTGVYIFSYLCSKT